MASTSPLKGSMSTAVPALALCREHTLLKLLLDNSLEHVIQGQDDVNGPSRAFPRG